MTLGIKWVPDNLVPDDEKKWFNIALRGYVRHNIGLVSLPGTIGGFELPYNNSQLQRQVWFNNKHVAWIVLNPRSNGLPDDGNEPALQKQPASQEQSSGCGWDPGYGDE